MEDSGRNPRTGGFIIAWVSIRKDKTTTQEDEESQGAKKGRRRRRRKTSSNMHSDPSILCVDPIEYGRSIYRVWAKEGITVLDNQPAALLRSMGVQYTQCIGLPNTAVLYSISSSLFIFSFFLSFFFCIFFFSFSVCSFSYGNPELLAQLFHPVGYHGA